MARSAPRAPIVRRCPGAPRRWADASGWAIIVAGDPKAATGRRGRRFGETRATSGTATRWGALERRHDRTRPGPAPGTPPPGPARRPDRPVAALPSGSRARDEGRRVDRWRRHPGLLGLPCLQLAQSGRRHALLPRLPGTGRAAEDGAGSECLARRVHRRRPDGVRREGRSSSVRRARPGGRSGTDARAGPHGICCSAPCADRGRPTTDDARGSRGWRARWTGAGRREAGAVSGFGRPTGRCAPGRSGARRDREGRRRRGEAGPTACPGTSPVIGGQRRGSPGRPAAGPEGGRASGQRGRFGHDGGRRPEPGWPPRRGGAAELRRRASVLGRHEPPGLDEASRRADCSIPGERGRCHTAGGRPASRHPSPRAPGRGSRSTRPSHRRRGRTAAGRPASHRASPRVPGRAGRSTRE